MASLSSMEISLDVFGSGQGQPKRFVSVFLPAVRDRFFSVDFNKPHRSRECASGATKSRG
jgi:hypothetical protein